MAMARMRQSRNALASGVPSNAVAREIGATDRLAYALSDLGTAYFEHGDLVSARGPLEEALALAQESEGDSHVFERVATALG